MTKKILVAALMLTLFMALISINEIIPSFADEEPKITDVKKVDSNHKYYFLVSFSEDIIPVEKVTGFYGVNTYKGISSIVFSSLTPASFADGYYILEMDNPSKITTYPGISKIIYLKDEGNLKTTENIKVESFQLLKPWNSYDFEITHSQDVPTLPSKPLNLRQEIIDDQSIKLVWNTPETIGSLPILKYDTQYKNNEDNWITTQYNHNSQKDYTNNIVKFESLDNMDYYQFRVIAQTPLGSSPPSDILYDKESDKVVPIITAPKDITLYPSFIFDSDDFGIAQGSDGMDQNPVITHNATGYKFPIGTTIIEWTITDWNDNVSIVYQKVNVLLKWE